MTDRRRGAVTVEAVLLIPAVLVLLCLMVAGWRLWAARGAITQAAAAGARSATTFSSAAEARAVGEQVALANLSSLAPHCSNRVVVVDTSDFGRPAGQPGEVTVRVSCRVPLSDLLVPGLPGGRTVTVEASQVLDTFKERRP